MKGLAPILCVAFVAAVAADNTHVLRKDRQRNSIRHLDSSEPNAVVLEIVNNKASTPGETAPPTTMNQSLVNRAGGCCSFSGGNKCEGIMGSFCHVNQARCVGPCDGKWIASSNDEDTVSVPIGASELNRAAPSNAPVAVPTAAFSSYTAPSPGPTGSPATNSPTSGPTGSPTAGPTAGPTESPTAGPTAGLTGSQTSGPTGSPTDGPTSALTDSPTDDPTTAPTGSPTDGPTSALTDSPTDDPTSGPTGSPTDGPTSAPTKTPSAPATTLAPTVALPGAFPCECEDTWSTKDEGCTDTQYGCPEKACDGADLYKRWCIIKESSLGCNTMLVYEDTFWSYCE